MICARCKATVYSGQLYGKDDGPLVCSSCRDREEHEANEEKNGPSPQQEAKWREEEKRQRELQEFIAATPVTCCQKDGAHGRYPAVGFDEKGRLVCEHCLGDAAPARVIARLEARLAALEERMVAPAPKASAKAASKQEATGR